MTYIELFNQYWRINRTNLISPMCATLYFYLLHECNIRRWSNPFELRTRQIELEIGLSRDTINSLRDVLKQRGLIDFQNGKGKAPARYQIVGVELSGKPLVVDKSDNKTDNKSGVVDKSDNKPTTNPTTEQNTHYIDKDIKTKENNKPPNPPCAVQGEFDFGKPKKGERKPRGEPTPEPPTIEEVKKHFIAQGAPARILNWEREAETFYNHFMSIDWVDARGRKIKRWDSRANLWISDKEKNRNEQSTTSTLGNSGRDEREARFRAKIMSDLARGERDSAEGEVPF